MLELKVCCTGRYMSADTIAGVKQRGVKRRDIANSSDGPPNAHGKSYKERNLTVFKKPGRARLCYEWLFYTDWVDRLTW